MGTGKGEEEGGKGGKGKGEGTEQHRDQLHRVPKIEKGDPSGSLRRQKTLS